MASQKAIPGYFIASLLQLIGVLLFAGGLVMVFAGTNAPLWSSVLTAIAGIQLFGFGALIVLVGRVCGALEAR